LRLDRSQQEFLELASTQVAANREVATQEKPGADGTGVEISVYVRFI
jgi:hypothetical protein